eukprot:366196-Chlamydomonas_euryale.AAC.3
MLRARRRLGHVQASALLKGAFKRVWARSGASGPDLRAKALAHEPPHFRRGRPCALVQAFCSVLVDVGYTRGDGAQAHASRQEERKRAFRGTERRACRPWACCACCACCAQPKTRRAPTVPALERLFRKCTGFPGSPRQCKKCTQD